MKQIEKFLIVIMILTIVSIAGTYVSNILLVRAYSSAEYGKMIMFNTLVALIFLVFRMLVHICIAIWLFITAREHKWAWLVFGIFFGILAGIFFYLARIYDLLRAQSGVSSNPSA